jgi:hypothetical protein
MQMIEANPFEEAKRVLKGAEGAGVELRATGGVAVGLRCPSAHRPPLSRSYHDLDFVVAKRQRRAIEGLFHELGYEPEEEFNALHGESRMFFLDRQSGREADVFIDAVRGCHRLDVADRLRVSERTLAPADLLLSKLQVRETNRKDHLDIFALLVDCELGDDDTGINRHRLTQVCCSDWGWWRTVTGVASGAEAVAAEILADEDLSRVTDSLRGIHRLLEDAPKSRRWRLRAKVGERVPWYQTPEELDHDHAPADTLG